MKNTKLMLILIIASAVSPLAARCWTNRNGERVCDDRHWRPVRGTLRRTGETLRDTGRGLANIATFGAVERSEDQRAVERSEDQREADIREDERRCMELEERD